MNMGSQLTLSVIEILVLMVGATTLGITIHFFIVSRRSLNESMLQATGKSSVKMDEWKLRYFNDIEARDRDIEILRKKIRDIEENNEINIIEADEMRAINKKLLAEIEQIRKATPQVSSSAATKNKPDYIDQLRQAQANLLEHNEKMNNLLGQIKEMTELEDKQKEILKTNEEMAEHIEELELQLAKKEREVSSIKQKEHLSVEMTSLLDSAHAEFNALQQKIQKLEAQVTASRKNNLEYEDMKEAYYKISKDLEEQKKKYNTIMNDNRQLLEDLTDAEDKLKEANYQRQQLHKRVSYLEELNNDMEGVAEANKNLQNQLKRIGELESKLNIVAEERDQLKKNKE
jgi:chromosome segregation ATPase